VTALDPVPLFDVGAQNAPLQAELRAAAARVLASGRFILGPEVEAFEAETAAFLGVRHALGVSSGTDALLLALMALEVGPGDEVVTTPFTFFATAGCIARLGATPVFVDIDPVTFNLDPAGLEAAIGSRTKALVPVHLFGLPAAMDAIGAVAARHGVPVVEDAAQAFGASREGRRVGVYGAVGCFSFFPSKNLGGFGDGGLVTTEDDALAARMRVLRVHGAEPKYHHAWVGGNFRLDALQAALLRVKLPHVDRWAEARRANARAYAEVFREAGLPRGRLAFPDPQDEAHTFNQYVIRTDRRDALAAELAERGISTAVYYPAPLHLQPCFAGLGVSEGSLPEAERACREVLALPIQAELAPDRVRRVAETVIDLLGRSGREA